MTVAQNKETGAEKKNRGEEKWGEKKRRPVAQFHDGAHDKISVGRVQKNV